MLFLLFMKIPNISSFENVHLVPSAMLPLCSVALKCCLCSSVVLNCCLQMLPLVLPSNVASALMVPSSRQLADSNVELLLETTLLTFHSTLLLAKYRKQQEISQTMILTTIQVWGQSCVFGTGISSLVHFFCSFYVIPICCKITRGLNCCCVDITC